MKYFLQVNDIDRQNQQMFVYSCCYPFQIPRDNLIVIPGFAIPESKQSSADFVHSGDNPAKFHCYISFRHEVLQFS